MSPQLRTGRNLPLIQLELALCNLKSVHLFSNIPDKDMVCFQKASQVRLYKKGKSIYLQNEPTKFFYVVGSGWIKLFRTLPEGQEVIFDILTTGRIFGEDAIFEQDVHYCSAQVVEDVQLLSIPASLLKEQIRLNPALASNMFSYMSKHHRHHLGALAFNNMLSAPQRIGLFLLRLCTDNLKTDVVLNLPYNKTLIADMLGISGATFSRSLVILQRKTGTHVKGTRVKISSVQRLAEYVYGPDSGEYSSKNAI